MKSKVLIIIGIILLAAGGIFLLIGALFKLESWPAASEILTAGVGFSILGIAALSSGLVAVVASK